MEGVFFLQGGVCIFMSFSVMCVFSRLHDCVCIFLPFSVMRVFSRMHDCVCIFAVLMECVIPSCPEAVLILSSDAHTRRVSLVLASLLRRYK